jgi:hypothetical protein
MNKYTQSAYQILKRIGKPLNFNEITQKSLESGILETDANDPARIMHAIISRDIKFKKEASFFIKTKDKAGFFGLNEKIKPLDEKIEAEEVKQEEKIRIDGSFIGTAGEYAVCSELLFRGFNASIMSVDVGVDISAIKDSKFFGIQVKTSQKNNRNIYNFIIRKKSFDRFNHGNIFYILVLRDNKKSSFIILPSSEIEKKIKEGAIFAVNNKTGYALNVILRDEKIYLGNRSHEMSYFLDNWNLIK